MCGKRVRPSRSRLRPQCVHEIRLDGFRTASASNTNESLAKRKNDVRAAGNEIKWLAGRGSRIRTCDLKYPKLPRYQAALYPVFARVANMSAKREQGRDLRQTSVREHGAPARGPPARKAETGKADQHHRPGRGFRGGRGRRDAWRNRLKSTAQAEHSAAIAIRNRDRTELIKHCRVGSNDRYVGNVASAQGGSQE
jgi:hypothetical protein